MIGPGRQQLHRVHQVKGQRYCLGCCEHHELAYFIGMRRSCAKHPVKRKGNYHARFKVQTYVPTMPVEVRRWLTYRPDGNPTALASSEQPTIP